jgi:hypothetical protein
VLSNMRLRFCGVELATLATGEEPGVRLTCCRLLLGWAGLCDDKVSMAVGRLQGRLQGATCCEIFFDIMFKTR